MQSLNILLFLSLICLLGYMIYKSLQYVLNDEPIKNNEEELISDSEKMGISPEEYIKEINKNYSPEQEDDKPMEVVIKEGGLDTSKLLDYKGARQASFKFRPNTFEEFVGQDLNKEIIKDALKGIRMGEFFHFFFYAKPGVGKTSLALVMKKELDAEIIQFIGKQITMDSLTDAMNVFHHSKKEHCILFIDETDTVKPELCKIMNPMIEDFKLGDKQLRPFIFIGCSINKNILIQRGNGDFLGRINYPIMFDKYNKNDIMKILTQYIKQVYSKEKFSNKAIEIIAENCRNEPRKAIHMLKHYRINKNINKMIENYKIIKNGLTSIDVKVLQVLNSKYPKTMSASALSQNSGVNTNDYITDIEPFLVEQGYLERPHKRIISQKGIGLLKTLEVKI